MKAIEDQARSIFLAALERAADQWPAVLAEACGDNAELRVRVEQLLQAHQAMGSIHGGGPGQPVVTVDELPVREGLGAMIGPYKLLEQIGEGGFGVVYMAEQTQPVRRKVALKVLKPGMDTKQVVARFEAERQALAIMDHPHIAKVHDGGATASGRPYFVMELVKGLPITKFCDQNYLTPRQRLELFIPVCQAVQHAHQKAIIHRDLKPSNVLVTVHDTTPVPKVIDFGVAKALGHELTDKTLFTGFAQMIGTPLYMSPEQAGQSGLDIDTRSDIYSLGVLLYELLTGTTPFDKERFKEAAYDEIRRIIREEDPPKPSTRLSELGSRHTPCAVASDGKRSVPATLASISAQRQTEPAKLTKLVRGELDWIVMKCLEKDRNRRYESANDLATDVRRFLADEPVLACPPSRWYRLRKFVRRNKLAFTVGALFVAVLLVATAVSTGLAVWARRSQALAQSRLEMEEKQRQRARAALDTMLSPFISEWLAKQPVLAPEHKKFLEYALNRYEEFAADARQDEEARVGVAHAYHRVGGIRQYLGHHDEAAASVERARELYARLVTDYPAVPQYRQFLAQAHVSLGNYYSKQGRYGEAAQSHQRAVAAYQQLAAEYPKVAEYSRGFGRVYGPLGHSYIMLGKPGDAVAAFEQGLAMFRQLSDDSSAKPEDHAEMAELHEELGRQYGKTGRLQLAEESFGQAIRIMERLSQESPEIHEFRTQLARFHHSLGIMYRETARSREAKAAMGTALTISKQLAAEFPSVPYFRFLLAVCHSDLGLMLFDRGDLPEAEHEFRQALALYRQLAGDFPMSPEYRRELARTLNGLGLLLKKAERLKEAEEAYIEAVAHRRRIVDENPNVPARRQDLAVTLNNLATLLRDTARPEEAKANYQEAVALHKQLADAYPHVSDHQNEAAGAMVNLARLHRTLKRPEEARRLLEEALPYHQSALRANPRHPVYRSFFRINRWRLAEVFVDLTDHAAAAAAAAEFLELATEPARDAYTAASLFATCARLAEEDAHWSAEKRADLANAYRDRALVALQRSVERGFKDTARIKTDQTLDPLRSRAEFQQLLSGLGGGQPSTPGLKRDPNGKPD